ncbi:Uncharacterised protein [Vibrio cholerae]|nr:Uncharacterised protein [Vibrio cholerae]
MSAPPSGASTIPVRNKQTRVCSDCALRARCSHCWQTW